jgi:hypothetical protein
MDRELVSGAPIAAASDANTSFASRTVHSGKCSVARTVLLVKDNRCCGIDDRDAEQQRVARNMHSTYQGMARTSDLTGMHRRFGLTDPTTIETYASRRAEDPSLLSASTGPSYADFFAAPAI